MKTSIERAWESASRRVAESSVSDGDYVIFRVDSLSDTACFGGTDLAGNLLLAIEVKALPPLIEIRSAAIDYFRQERKGLRTWLLVFRLKSADLTPVFGRLCQDLIDEISGVGTEQAVLSVVQRRIALWQGLFANGADGLLADFQIKGLVAELLFMESRLSVQGRTALEVVNAWLGPSGGDQDFIFSDGAFEVKAIGPHSESVCISSLRQLESSLPLWLCIWTMRNASPAEPKSETLNAVVARLEQTFARDPNALARFRNALLEVGYVAHPRYDEVAFEPLSNEVFVVDDGFPRLTTATAAEGVVSASYEISLQKIRSLA